MVISTNQKDDMIELTHQFIQMGKSGINGQQNLNNLMSRKLHHFNNQTHELYHITGIIMTTAL